MPSRLRSYDLLKVEPISHACPSRAISHPFTPLSAVDQKRRTPVAGQGDASDPEQKNVSRSYGGTPSSFPSVRSWRGSLASRNIWKGVNRIEIFGWLLRYLSTYFFGIGICRQYFVKKSESVHFAKWGRRIWSQTNGIPFSRHAIFFPSSVIKEISARSVLAKFSACVVRE